jgi:hypothetical protein
LDQILAENEENLAPFNESQLQPIEETGSQSTTSATDSDSGSAEKKEPTASKANYGETPELAKNQKHSENFNQVVQSLVKEFSEGVDVFQGAK